ncbi:MAG TPA: hypothetical protein VN841_18455 [Bryobacteraceae bacterium]|nr:hypothetical protein [Bryobacteraceae bacterium]
MKTWLRHPAEDVLDEYAFRRLGEAEAAPLEEHLLVCETCQERLHQIDDFVLVMKQAAPELALPAVSGGWRVRWNHWLFGWLDLTPGRATLAGAMVVLSAVAIVDRPRTRAAGPPIAVTLDHFLR